MNRQKAYKGAMNGLNPITYPLHTRGLQVAMVTALARWRHRGAASDGSFVSTYDLMCLKPVVGKKELK